LRLKGFGRRTANSQPKWFCFINDIATAKYLRNASSTALTPSSMDGPAWLNLELKWRGHEFLSTLRDPTVWEKTKTVASKAGGGGVQILLEIGKTIITEAAKEQLKKIGLG